MTETTAGAPAAAATTDLFTEIWTDIKTEAAKVWGEVKTDAIVIGQTAYADFKQVLKVGVPIAVAAVAAEVPKLATGQEKFDSASTHVAQQLQTQLGPVAMQDVWTLVQMAFHGIEDIAGGVPSAAPPAEAPPTEAPAS